ncbi:MAG: hypothetical protein KBB86_01055 [Candidatus Pacebacteria bacterium]|nr:hypothetical protein [Candidatus Paceibacterota bacterium]
MKDFSIEYAHIYTNSKIDLEHDFSIQVLGGIYSELGLNAENSSLVVMVDDYSFPDPTFDYTNFTNYLNEKNFRPDIIIRESQLIAVCDEVLNKINNNTLKEQLIGYVKNKKYPCSLFIASWYMLRLGIVSSPFFDEKMQAEKLINILPKSFEPFEVKALEIINSTGFGNLTDRIENKYFEGRSIA